DGTSVRPLRLRDGPIADTGGVIGALMSGGASRTSWDRCPGVRPYWSERFTSADQLAQKK
ncbi:MAG TPA: hypothetical protein P5189_03205, partial [Methanomassiliicoccales archaeon]|nr:hypothetical protein [Methanomassiliicoccales archaeon]